MNRHSTRPIFALAVSRPILAARAALRIGLLAAVGSGCAASARGPPSLSVDIALERARQALCTAGGVESPRALVAALAPDAHCAQATVSARVRCYLELADTAVAVTPIADGYRLRVVIPQLSDHVHDVTVRRLAGGRIRVMVDSAN